MSFCSNCGSENREDAAICKNCGQASASITKPIGSDGSSENPGYQVKPANDIKPDYQVKPAGDIKPGYQGVIEPDYQEKPIDSKKRRKPDPVLFVCIAIALILAGSATCLYVSAKISHDRGVSEMESGDWANAYESMGDAQKKGILFFRNSLREYDEKYIKYCKDQVDSAQKYVKNEDYIKANRILKDFPAESSYKASIASLEEEISKAAEKRLNEIDSLIDAGSPDEARSKIGEFNDLFKFAPYLKSTDEKMALLDQKASESVPEDALDMDSSADGTAAVAVASSDELPVSIEPAAVDQSTENVQQDYIIPDSSTRELTQEDLAGLTKEDLGYARNEIFARHGYVFKTDKYKTYFQQKSWYQPDENYREEDLSRIERFNVRFLKENE